MILALECNCGAADRLAEVRDEVQKILPDTKVLELETDAQVRAFARKVAGPRQDKDLLLAKLAGRPAPRQRGRCSCGRRKRLDQCSWKRPWRHPHSSHGRRRWM